MATPEHDPPIIGWLDDEETVELTLAPEPEPPATTITVSGVTYTARAAGEWVEVDVTAGPGRPLTGGPYMVAGGGSGGSGDERCARCHAEPRHAGSELCVRCLWPEAGPPEVTRSPDGVAVAMFGGGGSGGGPEPFPRSPRGLDDAGLRPAPPPLCTLTAWCVERPGHAGACTPRPADAFPPADFGPRAATSTRRGRT